MNGMTQECYAQLRTGNLEIVYVRYDDRADRFYCTLKPNRALIEGLAHIPNATQTALAPTDRGQP